MLTAFLTIELSPVLGDLYPEVSQWFGFVGDGLFVLGSIFYLQAPVLDRIAGLLPHPRTRTEVLVVYLLPCVAVGMALAVIIPAFLILATFGGTFLQPIQPISPVLLNTFLLFKEVTNIVSYRLSEDNWGPNDRVRLCLIEARAKAAELDDVQATPESG